MNKSFLSFLIREQSIQTDIKQLDMASARFKYPGANMDNACGKYLGSGKRMKTLHNQCMYNQLNKQQREAQ